MKKSRLLGALCAYVFIFIGNTSHAELEPIILDTTLNIYWGGEGNFHARYKLTDERFAEIIAAVGSVDGHVLTAADFDYNGTFTWWGAMAWADQFVYGGFNDWRLPNMDVNVDGIVVDCQIVTEVECRDNEYGYLYQYNGVSAASPGVFSHVEGRNWSLTESDTDRAWFFGLYNTSEAYENAIDRKSNTHFAFIVRDVTTAPLLPTLWLQITGTAEGGQIFFTLAGVALSVTSTDGLTSAQVAQALAETIANDATLSAIGVTALAVGNVIYFNKELTEASTTDPGLVLRQSLGETLPADGDINLDGAVNAADVLLGQQVLNDAASLTSLQLSHADVAPLSNGSPNPDGLFTLGDLLVIERKVLGVIDF